MLALQQRILQHQGRPLRHVLHSFSCMAAVFVKNILPAQEAGYQTAAVCNVVSEQVMADDKEIQWLIKMISLFTGQFVSPHLQETLRNEKLANSKHYLNPCQDSAKTLQKISILLYRKLYSSTILDIIVAITTVTLIMGWYNRACKKQGDKNETCAICLQEYRKGDLLKVLPCSHASTVTALTPGSTSGPGTRCVCAAVSW